MKNLLLTWFIGIVSFSCFGADKLAVPADRWIEIDLFWFNRDNIPGSVDEFWKGGNQVTGTGKLYLFLDQAESKLFTIKKNK